MRLHISGHDPLSGEPYKTYLQAVSDVPDAYINIYKEEGKVTNMRGEGTHPFYQVTMPFSGPRFMRDRTEDNRVYVTREAFEFPGEENLSIVKASRSYGMIDYEESSGVRIEGQLRYALLVRDEKEQYFVREYNERWNGADSEGFEADGPIVRFICDLEVKNIEGPFDDLDEATAVLDSKDEKWDSGPLLVYETRHGNKILREAPPCPSNVRPMNVYPEESELGRRNTRNKKRIFDLNRLFKPRQ